jgi:predicted lipid-binding transport protein (Tim44 family)
VQYLWKNRLLSHVLWLTPIVLLVCVEIVIARPGGGNRYSGGGGSSGGGGGVGDLVFFLIWLCIRFPLLGIPVAIIVLFVMYKGGQNARTFNESRVIRKGREKQETYARNSALDTLIQKDPTFDEQAFLERVKTAVFRLQRAWCQQDIRPVRHFLSDAVFERFNLQIAMQQAKGVKDRMLQSKVLGMDIVQLESDAVFDTVSVRIRATAIDYQVSIKNGQYVSGSKLPEQYTEYWSFVRRPGAKTREGKGLIEGNCPNCGDRLEMNEAVTCDSCGSLIKSGEYDWILAEITQASEWRVKETLEIPGAALLRKADPGFSVQHLEDRVSVMFWRVIEAYRTGNSDPMRKVATDQLCAFFADNMLDYDQKGRRVMPDDAAVGSVETQGIALGKSWDYALVQVRWSAIKTVVSRKGEMIRTGTGASIYTHVYLLRRQHGVISNISRALSSAHCANCGAPASEKRSRACEYCGTTMNSGEHDWVLESIDSPYGERIQQLRSRFGLAEELRSTDSAGSPGVASNPASPPIPGHDVLPGGLEASAWMINVLMADGRIDPKERKLLFAYASARGITQQRIEQLLTQALQGGTIDVPEPGNRQEARAWLVDMTRMALADGSISKEEEQLLIHMGKRLGFSIYDLKQVVIKTRRTMYQEAKSTLRQLS